MRLPQDYRSLARVLKAWNVEPPVDPSFRAKVWRRVESGDRGVPFGAYLRSNAVAVTVLLAVAVVVGAIFGWRESQIRAREDRADLAADYAHEVDARWMKAR